MIFHLYGLFIGLGIISGILLSEHIRLKYFPKILVSVYDLFFWVLIPALLGARFYHVLDYWEYYSGNFWRFWRLDQGGMAIYGAILGGFLGLWLFSKVKKIVIWNLVDPLAFGLPLGQAIGRLGNYFNQELYGLPTTLPWGITINNQKYHPLFSYEALADLLILILLLYLLRKQPRKQGFYFFCYLIFYGLVRFFLEFLRIHPWQVYWFTMAQIWSLLFIILGIWGVKIKK